MGENDINAVVAQTLKEATRGKTPEEAGPLTHAFKKMFNHVLKVATQYTEEHAEELLVPGDKEATWERVKERMRSVPVDSPEQKLLSDTATAYVYAFLRGQRERGTKHGGRAALRICNAFDHWYIPYNAAMKQIASRAMTEDEKKVANTKQEQAPAVQKRNTTLQAKIKDVITWLAKVTTSDFRVAAAELRDSMEADQALHRQYVMEQLVHIAGRETAESLQGKGGKPRYLAMKDEELRVYVLAARAMVALMVVTGFRSVAFWNMAGGSNIQPIVDGSEGILLWYKSSKTGNTGLDFVQNAVRVVYNVDPSVDAIIALHQYVYVARQKPALWQPDFPFRLHNTSRDYWWKRMVSIVMVASNKVGCGDVFNGYKKLHALRAFSATTLVNKGAMKEERDGMLGWGAIDTESRHYVSKESMALANKGPFIAAGRIVRGRDTDVNETFEPPAMWSVLSHVEGDFTDKIVKLAAAVNLPGVPEVAASDTICKLVHDAERQRERDVEVGRGTKRQAEQIDRLRAENAMLRKSKAQRGEDGAPVAVPSLEEVYNTCFKIVDEHLFNQGKDPDFPQLCLRVVKEHDIVRLLHMVNDGPAGKRGFGLAGSTMATGEVRKLVIVLRLAATSAATGGTLTCELAGKPSGASWFTWARTHLNFMESKCGGPGTLANWHKIASFFDQEINL
jgi:hypothetical protein